MATPMTVRDLRAALFAVADQEAEVWVMSADQAFQINAVEPMHDGVYILLIDPDEMPLETALFETGSDASDPLAPPPNTDADGRYRDRVTELEAEGATTSDAQGVADVEFGLDLSRWA